MDEELTLTLSYKIYINPPEHVYESIESIVHPRDFKKILIDFNFPRDFPMDFPYLPLTSLTCIRFNSCSATFGAAAAIFSCAATRRGSRHQRAARKRSLVVFQVAFRSSK